MACAKAAPLLQVASSDDTHGEHTVNVVNNTHKTGSKSTNGAAIPQSWTTATAHTFRRKARCCYNTWGSKLVQILFNGAPARFKEQATTSQTSPCPTEACVQYHEYCTMLQLFSPPPASLWPCCPEFGPQSGEVLHQWRSVTDRTPPAPKCWFHDAPQT